LCRSREREDKRNRQQTDQPMNFEQETASRNRSLALHN
jgi:hypothetical protein